AIPMMLGLLRPFRRSGPTAALTSWAAGLLAFWLVNYPINWSVEGGVPLQYQVSIPLAVSLVLYVLVGFLRPEDTP
ncbi:Na+:solute symporter, partial [Streptomyces sp. TRM76130]|nr:Na+:solute symporter [Streptomyces sp. TRM76130]